MKCRCSVICDPPIHRGLPLRRLSPRCRCNRLDEQDRTACQRPAMRIRRCRRVDILVLAGVVVLAGLAAVAGVVAAEPERVARLWPRGRGRPGGWVLVTSIAGLPEISISIPG